MILKDRADSDAKRVCLLACLHTTKMDLWPTYPQLDPSLIHQLSLLELGSLPGPYLVPTQASPYPDPQPGKSCSPRGVGGRGGAPEFSEHRTISSPAPGCYL